MRVKKEKTVKVSVPYCRVQEDVSESEVGDVVVKRWCGESEKDRQVCVCVCVCVCV